MCRVNLWPPILGAGVRVTRVSPGYREVDVTPRLGPLNRNHFGTQFGGSMFAMTDPFVDADGETVAEVDKALYIRRRDAAAPWERAPARRPSASKA